jgi:hypothetical protein
MASKRETSGRALGGQTTTDAQGDNRGRLSGAALSKLLDLAPMERHPPCLRDANELSLN